MLLSMKLYLSITLVFIFSASCASLDPSRLTKDQTEVIAKLAREKINVAITDMTESDRQYIKENEPRFSYYSLSGTYAQYLIFWDVEEAYRIVVSGQGDIMTLEGATVRKVRQRENGEPGPHGDGSGK